VLCFFAGEVTKKWAKKQLRDWCSSKRRKLRNQPDAEMEDPVVDEAEDNAAQDEDENNQGNNDGNNE
jgi:hypothetical protein